jgi:hypothetical protein
MPGSGFCSGCGSALNDGDAFCFRCGRPAGLTRPDLPSTTKSSVWDRDRDPVGIAAVPGRTQGNGQQSGMSQGPQPTINAPLDTDLTVPQADAPGPIRLIHHYTEPSAIKSAAAWYSVFSIFGIALVVAGIVCLFIHGNQVATDNVNDRVNQKVANYFNNIATITHPSALLLVLGWIGVGVGTFVVSLVLIFALVRRSWPHRRSARELAQICPSCGHTFPHDQAACEKAGKWGDSL